MTDPIIVKILYGLIATSVMGMIITIIANNLRGRFEDFTQKKKVGSAIFALVIVIWYIGLIWYWISLLSQID